MKYIVIFALLFLCWMMWSGMFDAFHLLAGAVGSAIITLLSHDLICRGKKASKKRIIREALGFFKYAPWLLYQIVLANINVAYLVLHPKMPIAPSMIKYKSRLKRDVSCTTLANSITLTPGTITADIQDGEYYIHCLTEKSAAKLGRTEDKIAGIFGED